MAAQESVKWHHLSSRQIFEQLEATSDGLSSEAHEHRLQKFGKNALPDSNRLSLWRILKNQLVNPLIFILLVAAGFSLAVGDLKDATFILIVIFINGVMGAYQEYNAAKSAEAIKQLMKSKARVLRDGVQATVEAEELVPGDCVFLESGDRVPADIRLISLQQLLVDESFLTGESLPVNKNLQDLPESTMVSERFNMAFAGSTVMRGRAKGIVVETGMNTEVGKIANRVKYASEALPPLVQRMEKFTKQIGVFIIILSVVLALVLSYIGHDAKSIFFFIVALSVSAIPEGLPISLTVALSIATRRMSRRKVIVRRLPAVESLGSCTVIASDKTGTLTMNEQTVRRVHLPDGQSFVVEGVGYNGQGAIKVSNEAETQVAFGDVKGLDSLVAIAVMSNEAQLKQQENQWFHQGDAMDVALLALCYKLGTEPEAIRAERREVDLIPYESERKYSAAIYELKGETRIALKGAVETVLAFCKWQMESGEAKPLDVEKIKKEAERLAKSGYRVLAMAGQKLEQFKHKSSYGDDDIPKLNFFGLACFIDPLRSDAKASVDECKDAGITVKMITGDHPATAAYISKELGIANSEEEVVSGTELESLGNYQGEVYRQKVACSKVFARVSPVQKLEIVDAMLAQGQFVAVTGDGVNDAPAMKRANIGIAMGSGTDVAKEAGDMIVLDDRFSSIVAGVEEGRIAYDNVRKVIYLLVSTGAAEISMFLAAISLSLPLPLLPVQLLWLNLVTNGVQDKALAFERGHDDVMKRKPRNPNESVFNRLMVSQIVVSGLTMGALCTGLWYYLLQYTDTSETHARDLILLLMVCLQNVHVFNCRSEEKSIFRKAFFGNPFLIVAVLFAQGLHIACMHWPFMQEILYIEPITMQEWLLIFSMALPLILVMEVFKKVHRLGNKTNK